MHVYVITNRADGRLYVGKANNPERRWIAHQTVAKHRAKTPLHVAMRDLGPEAFRFEVVETCRSEACALEAERLWILRLKSDDPAVGYNLTSGGQGLTGCSEDTRRKMAAAKRGKAHSPEFAEKRAAGIRANGKKAAVVRRVLELHTQGLNQPEIAKAVGRTQARVNQLLKESGISAASHQGRMYSQTENEEALRVALGLRAQGMAYESIARRLGRSSSTVHSMLKGARLGISRTVDQ